MVQGRTTGELASGSWGANVMSMNAQNSYCSSNVEKRNAAHRKVSGHTVCQSAHDDLCPPPKVPAMETLQKRLSSLMNHIFLYIRWMAGCVSVLTWRRDGSRMHYGKKAGWLRQRYALEMFCWKILDPGIWMDGCLYMVSFCISIISN